jgi:hypothetical protein
MLLSPSSQFFIPSSYNYPPHHTSLTLYIHRVSIKPFLDYKHLLQENYVEYKFFNHYLSYFLKFYVMCLLFVYFCIPRSFFVINVCKQEKTLCSPCTFTKNLVEK